MHQRDNIAVIQLDRLLHDISIIVPNWGTKLCDTQGTPQAEMYDNRIPKSDYG